LFYIALIVFVTATYSLITTCIYQFAFCVLILLTGWLIERHILWSPWHCLGVVRKTESNTGYSY